MDRFFLDGEGCELYLRIRQDPSLAGIKSRLEGLYERYRLYIDPNFKSDARKHLQQRYWEMLSCVALLERGFIPNKIPSGGPEFWCEIEGRRIWFEAVCPNPGMTNGASYMPPLVQDREFICDRAFSGTFPEERFLSRITNALSVKLKKLVEKDINRLGCDDAVVILLNTGRAFNDWLPRSCDANNTPLFAKAIFPIGQAAAPICTEGGPAGQTINFYRKEFQNDAGKPIKTDFFSLEGSEHISAVIHSLKRVQDDPFPLGGDFEIVFNERARLQLPPSLFRWCKEYKPEPHTWVGHP